jgi:hypothetical protein
MDVDEALRRLRAADPGADVSGEWSGSPAQRRTYEREETHSTPRRRSVLLAVAAASVVVLVAIGAATLYRSGDVSGHGSALTPAGTARSRTDALLSDLLAAVPVLPGASARTSAPTPALAQPPTEPGSSNAVDRHAWWTAPGSADAALAYFSSRPPRGMASSGGGFGHSVQWLTFDGHDTPFAREVAVQVTVVAVATGTAVRADAQAIWIPARDPGAVIAGVTSVTVTVTRTRSSRGTGAPTVRRTLSRDDAQSLADVVNALPVPTPGELGCPAQFAGITDTLDFATSSGSVHVVDELTGCGGVTVRTPDGAQHGFQGGSLDRTLLRLLGLPAGYGLG